MGAACNPPLAVALGAAALAAAVAVAGVITLFVRRGGHGWATFGWSLLSVVVTAALVAGAAYV